MKGSSREMIGNLPTLNSPFPLFLRLYIFGETYDNHFSLSDQI